METLEDLKMVMVVLLVIAWLAPIPFCLFLENSSDANVSWGISSLWSLIVVSICYLLLNYKFELIPY